MANSTPTLAVALIVKNEAKHLQACLETVADWVDEIVILDSGSSDETEAIARRFTDKFYVNADWPGFGPQRRLAQSYVTADYVLWLDADERVTPELKASVLDAIQQNSDCTLYAINRISSAFGKFIQHSGWSPDWVVRLYKTKDTHYDNALVHEKVIVGQYKIKKLAGRLQHFTYENLHHYINKTTGYLKAWADERDGKKKSSLSIAIAHALSSFIKMYIIKLGFLDGKHGFILAWLSMNSTFIKYVDLYLRKQEKEK
ncbi:glycosyltransferase family 2 protein [Vibrio cholerae]|uniref:glycosyltransferase family 2 protein n=1 Tax=Vibrio cholerae TaxID=666 RepID=UPI0011D6E138|nr:glycosyltransferase family 2 protein [Vibrio cholerae]EGR4261592.1 glycosyltransferase family 2 protein [Vibrio cholerae]EKF9988738.1 glycosyltransferase family 2 protein [Vibrio cholerae]MDV2350913.1 glycosyltransferase family 2 protein [Vibrio cholerae]TXY08162.1 glycosyltransferase family 2 protein [Vibrio cholerae]TYA57447.1 glycosyltransferase family 2 protein [Vibrio cholerae]